jgi:hypothetical protein
MHAERCLAKVELDDDTVKWLSERPMRAHQVRSNHRCDLEDRHAGPHATLGQQGDGVEWWVRWTLTASEIVETDVCPAQGPATDDGDDPNIRLLLVNHPGRHSFEF